MINIYNERHHDIRKKCWYIGEGDEARQRLKDTMEAFYATVTRAVKASEEIRELNN